ncbi:hypothetical protein GALL_528530 [mine drainage metagenome]|uniref:Uncharacterized protein n=1 Tax=mine drainage metagenome TaxID=410659 RepID=A0A1J5PDJ6_9ZZZZ
MIEVAVSQHFFHPLDTWLLAASYLGVDFGDVEDVDAHVVGEAHRLILNDSASLVVVVTRDDQRGLLRKLGNALEHVFRRVAREVGNQLVVDRQVGGQHEEIVDAVRQVQVGDKRPHQTGFADASRERKAQRGKLPLEVLQGWEFSS